MDDSTPHMLRPEDLGKEDVLGDGPVLVTDDRAIRERGHLDVGDYSVMASTAHGVGAKAVSRRELLELARKATEVYGEFLGLVRAGMKKRHARYVRRLRLANHSWRHIARLCHERRWEWASWAPLNSQLAGMALCQRAAELHRENCREEPWN